MTSGGLTSLANHSVVIRVEQLVGVDDEVTHVGVVHRRLRLALPGPMRRLIARVRPDEVDLAQVPELGGAAQFLDLAADDEEQKWRS
jgi:hypothetical protein